MNKISKLLLVFVTLGLIGSFSIVTVSLAENGTTTSDSYSAAQEAAKKLEKVTTQVTWPVKAVVTDEIEFLDAADEERAAPVESAT